MNTDDINRLIEALREEITQLGELLALQQEQQVLIIERKPQELIVKVNEISTQEKRNLAARTAREEARLALISQAGGDESMPFSELIATMPADYQPLVDAQRLEINVQIKNVARWVRQNHLLLKRSLELMQDIMQNVFPAQAAPKTYGRSGAVSQGSPPPSTLYEGII